MPPDQNVDLIKNIQNIPASLRRLPQWVCWKYIQRNGRDTKCPIRSDTGAMADATDPSTWSTWDEALKKFQSSNDLAGVGFVFSPDDNFCGVDLDDCLDPATGQAKPWARQLMDQLDSYAEISPSGKGIKIFIRGSKPGKRCRKPYHDGEVEIYDQGRFFTVTGVPYNGSPADVKARQDALNAAYREIFGEGESDPPADSLPTRDQMSHPPAKAMSDENILQLASSPRRKNNGGEKFSTLWAGRWNDFLIPHQRQIHR